MSGRQYKMQRHRAGDGGTHWISYSDMMASLLLIFILAFVLQTGLLKKIKALEQAETQG